MNGKETVIGVSWIPGPNGKDILRQKVIVDGVVTYRDLEDVVSDAPFFNDRFKDTAFAPHDIKPATTVPIMKKLRVDTGATPSESFVQKHLDRSATLEALLIRIIGTPEKIKAEGSLNFNGKTELHEYAVLMCRAMGGEWEDVIPLLHAGRKG